MKRIWLPVLILSLLSLPTISSAQADQEVHEVFFDTLVSGFKATPIGVDEMKYVGTEYITADDSSFMVYATRVIQRDLDFHATLDLVLIDSFYIKTYEIKELNLLAWKRLGADLVVRLEAEFSGSFMRVSWRLSDTRNQQQFASGKLEKRKSDWRGLAHDISNEIVHTLTGENGIFRSQVMFVKEKGKGRSQTKELYIADYDGANERQLTRSASINISPTYHPKRGIAFFTSFMNGNPQLFKVDVASGKVTQLTSYKGSATAPEVSPDGDKLACVLSKDGNAEIYVLDLNGRVIKRLTNHSRIDSAPTWSPDGSHIAFSSDRTGSPQIYIMDSDGLKTRRLTYEGRYNDSPIWSARGDRITFVSRTRNGRFNIASIDTSGNDFRVLTQVGHNENPHFSPDGHHIIFSSTRLGGRDIYTMDINGRNQRRVTRSQTCFNPNWGR